MNERVIAITGANGALGSALVAAAVASGAAVAAIDIDPAPKDKTGVHHLTGVDLIKPRQADAAMADVVSQFGRLDVLFNVAGGFSWETLAAGSADTWDSLYRLNVMTTHNACHAALPYLAQSPAGRIVNVGANAAVKAEAGMGAYAAAKAGVHRLTEALAIELKSGPITVNAVLPSILDTLANRRDMSDADFESWVKPAALAEIMMFLASDKAGAITGALLPVTGRV